MITFDDFKKLDLRVATILKAEHVGGSDKLLRLEIDLGNEQRQILAGIKSYYQPEELTGKQIIVAANLEPRQLMGLESQGMLLAADSPDGPVLLGVDKPVPPGSEIR